MFAPRKTASNADRTAIAPASERCAKAAASGAAKKGKTDAIKSAPAIVPKLVIVHAANDFSVSQ